MKKGRIEAFSDGVLAIIVTIMVLELKIPHGNSWSDLLALWPKFSSYILSFLMIIIYWNNHHHVFQTVEKVNGKILWTNGLLLFFLSLVPFGTAWMGNRILILHLWHSLGSFSFLPGQVINYLPDLS